MFAIGKKRKRTPTLILKISYTQSPFWILPTLVEKKNVENKKNRKQKWYKRRKIEMLEMKVYGKGNLPHSHSHSYILIFTLIFVFDIFLSD
jgi:hypothetical protein